VNGYVPACMCLSKTFFMCFQIYYNRASLGATPNFADSDAYKPALVYRPGVSTCVGADMV